MKHLLALPYEIWRDIKGYEGLYQVSNLGRARSVDRYVNHSKSGLILRKGKIIEPHSNKQGYLHVILCKNGVTKTFSVHRLVAMTFPDLVDWTEDAKGKPFEVLQVNHKDEHKDNNCVDNLEWCTEPYNKNYGNRTQKVIKKLINHPSYSKPVLQYTLNGQFVTEYPSAQEAERQTGINHSNISQCCRGRLHYNTAGGYIWKYKD